LFHLTGPENVDPDQMRQRTTLQNRCQLVFTISLFGRLLDRVDCCPWGATSGRARHNDAPAVPRALYSAEERRRRDMSRWTYVQGVLAPIQFAVFLISLGLVLHYLATGNGFAIATGSVVLKTMLLYAILITGSIWERDVFGRYLFAPAFFWEDVVSILVLALHTTYLIALFSGAIDAKRQMWLALAAYVSYVINATQFLLKLRAARLQGAGPIVAGAVGHAP
jgi:3-vinyl bacteriochlorophyllide hydratase